MPMIAELRKIDGEMWARVPVTEGAGRIQILSDAEIAENDRKMGHLLSEIERLRALVMLGDFSSLRPNSDSFKLVQQIRREQSAGEQAAGEKP